ncbi:siderophore-interacting protein [Jiangella endophytica]|uniref:siderophore-interacting protein n=1 Tax=Jiangella endophytica TaxID=1623398 RepID=UPI000E34D22D|nr:siderophore-interacting protein [Jiangella endophytica]
MSAPAPRRRIGAQTVLTVEDGWWLGPRLRRVIAGGPEYATIVGNDFTDAYTKLFFAHPDTGLTPPYDLAELRQTLPPELLPSMRTYTVRRLDDTSGQLTIDFVVHGDDGIAGPWAATARKGDLLVMSGIGGGYAPDPAADWHLLAGDDAALPAIARALEAMPPDARGVALIEVDGDDDHVPLTAPSGVGVEWLHRDGAHPGTTTLLPDAVRGLPWRDGHVQVFAHGERGAMKTLRPYLTTERGLDRSQLSLSAYWAYGRAEDTFQAEKRRPVGQLFDPAG